MSHKNFKLVCISFPHYFFCMRKYNGAKNENWTRKRRFRREAVKLGVIIELLNEFIK